MLQPQRPSARSVFGSLVLIAVVVGASAAAFAYTAGWFSPQRLTPDKMVDALTPPGVDAARPSPEPCQGHLLHRRLRSERGRVGALTGPGFRPRPVSGPRALQSRHRRSERAGCDGPGARHGTADLDAGRAGMAHRHDRCPGLSGIDAAGLLRSAARLGEQGPGRDEDIRRRASGDRGVRRMGQERSLDRQLRGRAVQQPQQLHLRRQFRRGACGAMVAPAGGATGLGLAR